MICEKHITNGSCFHNRTISNYSAFVVDRGHKTKQISYVFLICSDSEAALMALRGGKSKARPDLINKILSVLFIIGRTGCEVMFCWVPGHAGVEGNEIVDSIAKAIPKKREVDANFPGTSVT